MATYKVVLEVVIQNVEGEAVEALHDDPILFIDDHDLYDDAEAVAVRELAS